MTATILATAILVGAPALKDPPKKDTGIVGEWEVESTAVGGKKGTRKSSGLIYRFTADGKWVIHRNGAELKSAPRDFKVNAKASPATIDVIYPQAAGAAAPPRTMPGIYKLEGNTLTICFAMANGERPKSFEPVDGVRTVVIKMKRAKKKE